jgi:hypothetical protein
MSTDGSADSDSIKTLPNGLIDIAEVCRVSGLTASALRFYASMSDAGWSLPRTGTVSDALTSPTCSQGWI